MDEEKIKKENQLTKDLLCVVVPEDVVTTDKQGQLFIGGTKLTAMEVGSLKSEAEFLVKTRLWSILTNSLKDQAMKVMFERSTTFDDMRAGKMMLYNLNVQEKIIYALLTVKSVVESKEGV